MMRLEPFHLRDHLEAGCDEAGRGCLAGPVFAAAVILRPGARLPGLDDSKKLGAEKREYLRPLIESRALAWCVAMATPQEIDEINILNASFLAMHRAIAGLHMRPQHLLIDGDRFKRFEDLPHTCMIKGDGRYRSIAAASVLAKTHRDEWMLIAHAAHPAFNWADNKGYPTRDHRDAIREHGPTPLHRRSFRLLVEEYQLF